MLISWPDSDWPHYTPVWETIYIPELQGLVREHDLPRVRPPLAAGLHRDRRHRLLQRRRPLRRPGRGLPPLPLVPGNRRRRASQEGFPDWMSKAITSTWPSQLRLLGDLRLRLRVRGHVHLERPRPVRRRRPDRGHDRRLPAGRRPTAPTRRTRTACPAASTPSTGRRSACCRPRASTTRSPRGSSSPPCARATPSRPTRSGWRRPTRASRSSTTPRRRA